MGLEFLRNRLISIKQQLQSIENKSVNQSNPINKDGCEPSQSAELAKVDASTVLAQYYNINCAQSSIIKPKVFSPCQRGDLTVLGKYSESDSYPYYDRKTARFTAVAQAKDLEIREPNRMVIDVSNFSEPFGTIAGTATLDKTLYTDRLIECAALAVVDKAHNTQTLIHVFPGYTVEANKQVINHILNASNPKDLEVSLVPGASIRTESTVQFLLDTVKEYSPDIDVKLFNFPKDGLEISNRGLLLQNGKLSCCDMNKVVDKIINPKNNISYIEPVKISSANDTKIVQALEKTNFDIEYDFNKLKNWAIDNNLRFESYNGRKSVEFLDNKDNIVRIVRADYPNEEVVKTDERFFYNLDGSIKGKLSKNYDGEIVYSYSCNDVSEMSHKKAYLHNGFWYVKNIGEYEKLADNPITGKSQI